MQFISSAKFCSILLLLIGLSLGLFAQQPAQINYQGVARNPDGSPVSDQAISLRISIRDGGTNAAVVYSETRNLSTNKFGLFTTVIGSAGSSSQTGNMNTVAWATGSKFLQVEIDPNGGSSFQNIGTSQLQSVPYAIYASQALPAGNASGDLAGSYPNPTVSRLQGLPISNLAPQNGQVLRWNGASWAPGDAATVGSTSVVINANVPLQVSNSGTGTTLSISPANSLTDGFLSRSDFMLFSNKTSKDYVDNGIAGLKAYADESLKGKIQLAGDLSGTTETPLIGDGKITTNKLAEAAVTDSKIAAGISAVKVGLGNVSNTSDLAKPVSTLTQAALDARELMSNKSTDLTADAASDVKYPSVKSVKTYVDATAAGDATAAIKGKIQLAGDLAGTAALPLVADGAITDTKIAPTAAIADTKLATISTAGKVANSATTAASANTASAIVARDASGNFSAGTITATLTGAATTAGIAANLSGGSAGLIPYQSSANTTALLAAGTSGQVLQSNGTAAPSWVTIAVSVREVNDEYAAANSQTSFTLTQVPSANSKLKMYVNGIRISNTAYSWNLTTLTYNPANNGSYALTAGDRIQLEYYY